MLLRRQISPFKGLIAASYKRVSYLAEITRM